MAVSPTTAVIHFFCSLGVVRVPAPVTVIAPIFRALSSMSATFLTAEQLCVSDALHSGINVVTNACPGAGKTFMILRIAQTLPGFGLMITFSKRLQLAAEQKITGSRLRAQTFHGACNSVDSSTIVRNDLDMEQFLEQPVLPAFWATLSFLAIDETQDMTVLEFRLVRLIMSVMVPKSVVLLVGDVRQNIFAGLKPTIGSQFLMNPRTFFTVEEPFVELRLTKSFRLTQQMVSWLKAHMNILQLLQHYPEYDTPHIRAFLSLEDLVGTGSGPAVLELAQPLPQVTPMIQSLIALRQSEDGNDSVTIIVHSVKHQSPGIQLVNRMRTANWNVIDSNSEYSSSDELTLNKSTVCTLFAMKGLEAQHVFFIGFDSFKEGYNNPLATFCEYFVGLTRGLKSLVVISNTSITPFATLREVHHVRSVTPADKLRADPTRVLTSGVRELLSFVTAHADLNAGLRYRPINADSWGTLVKAKTMFSSRRQITQDVTIFIGLAIEEGVRRLLQTPPCAVLDWSRVMQTLLQQQPYLRRQIDSFEWVDTPMLELAVQRTMQMIAAITDHRTDSHLSPTRRMSATFLSRSGRPVKVSGEVDFLLAGNYLIELKTSLDFTVDDAHQAAIYAALYERCCVGTDDMSPGAALTVYIVNPIAGDVREVQCVTSWQDHVGKLIDRHVDEKFGNEALVVPRLP